MQNLPEFPSGMGFTKDEADDFVDRVEDVNRQIADLISGKIDIKELEAKENAMLEKERLKKVSLEIKTRERDELRRKGRPGKGHQGGYLTFCKGCFREFVFEAIEVCTICGKDTITLEERMDGLKTKLEEHKQKTGAKKTRRGKWENWKKTQELFYRKTSTNYSKWDMFESSEEEVDPNADPILPKDDPNFKAMEMDFEERAGRRRKAKKFAEEQKVKGNECMKRGLYRTANKHYTEGLEEKKDYLAMYTNRALCRIKLELWVEAVDDCSRVLDYCEVFDNGYEKQSDLCYKAFVRRAQAYRGMRDFDLAVNDCNSAAKVLPKETDPAKLRKQYEDDKEHEARIAKIMANSESLKGKDFIDFLQGYMSGKTHAPERQPGVRLPKYCVNELKADEAKKLLEILKADEELAYYFNAKDGFKQLVDSLNFGAEALTILETLLPTTQKLREDFQRQHLYEAMIDFLYKRNVKAEGTTLPNEHVYTILVLLENASLDDVVRSTLSEMSKIKDLFLIVIRAINIDENMKLVSSLIQFVSNLCYGTGKFRKMLAQEPPSEFMATIESILKVTEKTCVNAEDKSKTDWAAEGKRVLLKQATINFVGNLCVEAKLRQHIAADMGGVLSRVYAMLETDVKTMPFDWIDSVVKEMAVCINCSLEPIAVKFFTEKGIVAICESVLKVTKFSEQGHRELMNRSMNIIAKVSKVESACREIMKSKTIIITCLMNYANTEVEDLAKQCLLAFHQCCRSAEFRDICFNEHKYPASTFDAFVKQSIQKYNAIVQQEKWNDYVNVCASITGFVTAFPERLPEFQELIIPLIKIVGDKTELVRKNAAVLLARLSTEESNAKIMRANHGTEVLVSLRQQL